jgi:hypothetical protein
VTRGIFEFITKIINISQTFHKHFGKLRLLKYSHQSKIKEIMVMSNKEMEMKALEHDMTDIDGKTAKKFVETVADGAVAGYKKIENAVVTGYQKMENGVVEGFGKVVDHCVEALFAKEGETVEEAKARLSRQGKS